MIDTRICEREFDFALIVSGIETLAPEVVDKLFLNGCSDATFSIQYGQVYAEFSREAPTLMDAIMSAIHDIEEAGVGASVLRVDECDLVTQAEIARRIGRTRSLVSQYIAGKRGPGGFPAPACYITDKAPLWFWCGVSCWLWQNNLIKAEKMHEAEAISVVNNFLEQRQQRNKYPALVERAAKLATH